MMSRNIKGIIMFFIVLLSICYFNKQKSTLSPTSLPVQEEWVTTIWYEGFHYSLYRSAISETWYRIDTQDTFIEVQDNNLLHHLYLRRHCLMWMRDHYQENFF